MAPLAHLRRGQPLRSPLSTRRGEGAPVKVSSPDLIPRWADLGEQVLCPTGAAEPKHNPCPCVTYHPLPTPAQPPPSALPPIPVYLPNPGPLSSPGLKDRGPRWWTEPRG